MASYQVMFWKHIPSQVMAWEGEDKAKRMLPDYFQAAIDAYAMKDGSTEMDAYLEGWHRGPVQERVYAQHAGVGWIGKLVRPLETWR